MEDASISDYFYGVDVELFISDARDLSCAASKGNCVKGGHSPCWNPGAKGTVSLWAAHVFFACVL